MPPRTRAVIVDSRSGRGLARPAVSTRGGAMSRLRRIAEIPAGSWTKWVVVGFWVVVLVLAFPLQKKLNGALKNDASAWLPANTQSTKVLDVQARFQSRNIT